MNCHRQHNSRMPTARGHITSPIWISSPLAGTHFLWCCLQSPWLDDLVPANGNILMRCEAALLFFFFYFRNHGTALFFLKKALVVDKACAWSFAYDDLQSFLLLFYKEHLPTYQNCGYFGSIFLLYEWSQPKGDGLLERPVYFAYLREWRCASFS